MDDMIKKKDVPQTATQERDTNSPVGKKNVLRIIKRIPRGKVATYKYVARAIGRPKAARAVGNALNKNPHAPQVPCHRIVKSDGSIGGYAKGVKRKIEILKKEGVVVKNNRIVDFKNVLYKF